MSDIFNSIVEKLAEWRYSHSRTEIGNWDFKWEDLPTERKNIWLIGAHVAVISLGVEVGKLIENWHSLGRSNKLIFNAVKTIFEAQEYNRKRKEIIESIKDPIMREVASR